MATSTTYYIDTPDFSTASAVWTDIGLTTKAPDGFYSFGSSYRQQFDGFLAPISSCIGDYESGDYSSSDYFI